MEIKIQVCRSVLEQDPGSWKDEDQGEDGLGLRLGASLDTGGRGGGIECVIDQSC